MYYWFDKSSESYVDQADIGRTTIPGKWRSWWHGPYKITKQLSHNVYELELKPDKHVNVNVNRIIPQDTWSSTLHDTSEIDWVHEGGTLKFSDGPPIIQDLPVNRAPVALEDLVAFPMKPTEECPLSFGIGKVIDINCENLNLQWYGNTHDLH